MTSEAGPAAPTRLELPGVMIAILVLGAVVSETNPYSLGTRIFIVAFFGAFIALCVWIWFWKNSYRNRIEVADDAIRYVRWSGEPAVVLSRPETGELRIVRRPSDRKLFLYDRLVIPGTGGWMNLRWFSTSEVRQACLARGWRFDGAS
ncbi:MAG TPA: hypothetical protein VIX15_02770 [Streptosporangiaceae bacterium]